MERVALVAFRSLPLRQSRCGGGRRGSQLLESGAGVTSNGAVSWVAVGRRNGAEGTASYVQGALVTGAYFEVLGIHPFLGRALTTADDVAGAENVIVISHGLWKRRDGGSRDTIGRRLTLGGTPFTIVGVMPPGLDYPSGVEVWRTVRSVPAGGVFGDAAHYEIDLIARLRPGVSIEQAASELARIAKRLEMNARPDHPRGLEPVVRCSKRLLSATSGWPCSRSSVRLRSFCLLPPRTWRTSSCCEAKCAAVSWRCAQRSGRPGQDPSLLFAESLTLATAAGAAAFVASWWSLEALLTLIPAGLPRGEAIRIDARVLAFTTATSCFVALAACIVPGLASVRRDSSRNCVPDIAEAGECSDARRSWPHRSDLR